MGKKTKKMKGFALICITMLTIAALGSTAPIALDSSEILQLKGLIAAERSVFAGSAGRKLQHASKKVTEGVDASKKSATSQQPKTIPLLDHQFKLLFQNPTEPQRKRISGSKTLISKIPWGVILPKKRSSLKK